VTPVSSPCGAVAEHGEDLAVFGDSPAPDARIVAVHPDEEGPYILVPGAGGMAEVLRIVRGPYHQLDDAQAALLVMTGRDTDTETARAFLGQLAPICPPVPAISWV
jgi:hypothetical protein